MSISRQNLSIVIVTFKSEAVIHECIKSIDKDIKGGEKISKTEISKKVAFNLAKKAQEKKITRIFFDRGIYRYHGRVKVFAETLRENGMEF